MSNDIVSLIPRNTTSSAITGASNLTLTILQSLYDIGAKQECPHKVTWKLLAPAHGKYTHKVFVILNVCPRSVKVKLGNVETSASARCIIRQTRGVQLKLWATFLSLTVCLYLLDSRDRERCLQQASKHKFGLLWPWSLTSWSPRSNDLPIQSVY